MARWWYRLGGRPVDHAASPRFIYCLLPEAIPMSRESKSYCNCLNLLALSTNTDTARVLGCASHPMPLH